MSAIFRKGLLAVALISLLLASRTKEPEAPLRVGTNVWPGCEPGLYGDTPLIDGGPLRGLQ